VSVTTKRDLRFDSLRGLMILCMTANHLPTRLRSLTDESLGLFSAAEGFVFLSGLMAGWIYSRKLRESNQKTLLKLCRERVKTIYYWHITAFTACLIVVLLSSLLFGFASLNTPRLFYQNPLLALGLGSIFLHQPGLLDILPMYCVMYALLPLILKWIEAGYRYTVLIISFSTWLITQIAPPMDTLSFFPIVLGSFNLYAWQFIFILGVLAGNSRLNINEKIKPRFSLILGAVVVILACLSIQHLGWRPLWSDTLFGISLNKPALGFMRLTNFGCVAYLVALLGSKYPNLFSWPKIAFLGKHSIAVFATQSVTAMILLQFERFFASLTGDIICTTLSILMLYLAAYIRELWQTNTSKTLANSPISS
jgi:hypothetical protein